MAERPLPIFDAFTNRLGSVPDEAVRLKRVRTRAVAMSYLVTFRYHHELNERLAEAEFGLRMQAPGFGENEV